MLRPWNTWANYLNAVKESVKISAGPSIGTGRRWKRAAIQRQGVFERYSPAEKILRLEKKAAAGDASAMFKLGSRYSEGIGIVPDPEQGQHWHKEAAEHGNAAAMFRLGVLYSNGLAPRADYRQACSWYEKTARRAGQATIFTNSLLLPKSHRWKHSTRRNSGKMFRPPRWP